MSPKNYLLLPLLLCCCASAFAQFCGFEKGIPQNFKSDAQQKLSLSSLYYKEGSQSLRWDFSPNGVLNILSESAFTPNANNGITLWIYNEKPQKDSIRFEFLTSQGEVAYQFGFRLASAGWRAC